MVTRTGRKITGGRYKKSRKKKAYERQGQRRIVKVRDKEKRKNLRARGGNIKTVLYSAKYVNVVDEKKAIKLEIKRVLETPSNRFLARQGIITKGAIIETEKGKVKITNRPSQEGIVNGIFIKE